MSTHFFQKIIKKWLTTLPTFGIMSIDRIIIDYRYRVKNLLIKFWLTMWIIDDSL